MSAPDPRAEGYAGEPAPAARRAAVVTGGGSGIGAASCAALAARGYDVVVAYNNSAREAAEVAAGCRTLGVDAVEVRADVADDAACRALVAAALARFGRLDTVVSSAGTTQFVPMDDLDGLQAGDFERVFRVNAIGPFQMARAAAPALRSSDNGAIVHVSSIAGVVGNGSSMAYVASKAALNALTLALARVLSPGIRVNAVLPGMVEGRWLRDGLGEAAYERVRTQWAGSAALGRVATPEEVAGVVACLAADAPMMTGQLLTVDGGFLLGRPTKVSR